MSRKGFENRDAVYAAAEQWRTRCLVGDGSIFGAGSLWALENFRGLDRYFVQNLDEGEGTFLGKLEGQLAPAPVSVKQLAAELMWVMLLCPSNTLAPKKREIVELIWSWSGTALPTGAPEFLSDVVLEGIGSAGPGYNNHRWRELVFAVRFGLAFKSTAADERRRLILGDGVFAQWLDLIKESRLRQFRHMLLHLIFPDSFERIFGGGHRRLIVQKFRSLSPTQVRKLTPMQIEFELHKIREEQTAKHPGKELDFYFEPLKSQWNPNAFEEYTADIELDDVKHALAEVDAMGVPTSAE